MHRDLLPPPVPYDRTSIRPAWTDLSPELRDALSHRLGGEVVSAAPTATGFTPGFAAVLTTVSGARYFVKAAKLSDPPAEWYAEEARFTSALPSRVPAAKALWSGEVAGHFVLCLEAIPGARVPHLPWSEDELDAALDALAQAATALTDPSPELLAHQPGAWHEVLDGTLTNWRRADPPVPPHPDRLPDLARLEARFDELTRHETRLIHCDLRLDNIVIDSAGKAWICDWNWLTCGPPWFDTVTLLLSAEASGIDVDRLFEAHPTAFGLAPDALDAGLAALAGFYCNAGAQPELDGAPNVRPHQRYYAQLSLRWLARRRGWI